VTTTIRIVTSHPALPHVLRRTAPHGVRIESDSALSGGGNSPSYIIDVEFSLLNLKERRAALVAWLSKYVEEYGVDRLETKGRVTRRDFAAIGRGLVDPNVMSFRGAGRRCSLPVSFFSRILDRTLRGGVAKPWTAPFLKP
jgi:hypothetical protein